VEDDGKSITGTDEEIAAKLQAFADIGVTHLIVILRPSASPATIERFARVVEVMDR
jgi:alkanesulfonate monooxygenase SsuD/methylene tetrahydromethanopterin reductase-like flavin-dependent oxidoreductase (luciferase family)